MFRNSLKAQQIAGKERNLDPEADDLEVVVNFYEAGDGTFQLQLPKLTAVKPVDKVNDVLDFINFDKKVCDGIHSSIKLVSRKFNCMVTRINSYCWLRDSSRFLPKPKINLTGLKHF